MADDFNELEKMVYSGRGITIGMTPDGEPFIGYSLTGRSPSSQARVLERDEKTNIISTDVTDEEQLKKGSPALLLYPAIWPVDGLSIAVSNGAQTKLIYSAIRTHTEYLMDGEEQPKKHLQDAFKDSFFEFDRKESRVIDITSFEPDAPNNTPRISGLIVGNKGALSIVRATSNNTPHYDYFHLDLQPGKANIITTYHGGNQEPLLPFTQEPLIAKIESNSAMEIAGSIYSAISHGVKEGENFAVSSAVMLLRDQSNSYIFNRFLKR